VQRQSALSKPDAKAAADLEAARIDRDHTALQSREVHTGLREHGAKADANLSREED